MRLVQPKLTHEQAALVGSKTRGTLFISGIRGGKTWALCILAVIKSLHGNRGAVVSFSYTMLRDVIADTLVKVCRDEFGMTDGVDFHWNRGDMVFTIGRGEILLRSADADDQVERLRGLTLDWFAIDEARNFKTNLVYLIMIGRISKENAQWYICTTPHGRQHWTADLIRKAGIDLDSPTVITETGNLTYINQATTANVFLGGGYIEELRQNYPDQYAEQEIGGKFIDLSAGILHSRWFRRLDDCARPLRGVRGWDMAATIKTHSDFSAGALLAEDRGRIVCHEVLRVKLEVPDLREKIVTTALADGPGVVVAIEQVGQQVGVVQDLQRDKRLAGYVVIGVRIEGDKLSRAMPWAARAQSGMCDVISGPWNQDFFAEMDAFSGDNSHTHDDQIDAYSVAYSVLAQPRTIRPLEYREYKPSENAEHVSVAACSIDNALVTLVICRYDTTSGAVCAHAVMTFGTISALMDGLARIKPDRLLMAKDFDSDNLKSIMGRLLESGLNPTLITDYDAVSLTWEYNRLVGAGLVYTTDKTMIAETMACGETPTKAVEALLMIISEVRTFTRTTSKEYKPFERQKARARERAAQKRGKGKSDGWA